MTSMERLAVAQAVFRAVAEVVSTKNPDSLRAQADADLMGMYDSMGVKSIDLKLEGKKVGTYSVTMAKATKETHEKLLRVTEPQRVLEWAKDNETEWDEFVSLAIPRFAQYCFEEYGEVPDGCEVEEVVTPAKPEHPKGTTLRVDPKNVADALQGRLPVYVAGFLEGGE
ncbi:MAG: hypothetical protein MR874_06855 [Coriobacteriaceae bacterium]|uniref:hypothetical protein n=1 Tax=Tractidigestivibacter sp. TaxID=2847320 RepID=UPI002A7EC19F|nr:hypothetical protein [Tractidigestivibacter sp.]MCI6274402.1 hypothetical protein [Coriobacteriaceae bacterium]MCI6844461.1 hypothetical protein [Coriobacteriaceae bacterium]MDY4535460.1 hypothetical protein [Tractidigestivibacter sp.]MDY5272155.1 hypothetical protein [Tractidigestivibacter sp.]